MGCKQARILIACLEAAVGKAGPSDVLLDVMRRRMGMHSCRRSERGIFYAVNALSARKPGVQTIKLRSQLVMEDPKIRACAPPMRLAVHQ